MADHRLPRSRAAGQILPIAALVLVPLLLIAAFAVDIGSWYYRASQLQRAADVAALAGAEIRGNGGTDAEVQAAVDRVLAANGIDPGVVVVNVDLSVPNDVTVDLSDDSNPLYFAGLVLDEVTVGRGATATSGACLGNCNQPIVITPPINDLPTNSQGDGFSPYVWGDNERILALNHHVDSDERRVANGWAPLSSLFCVDIVTRAACAGFPVDLDTTTDNETRLVLDETRDHVWYRIQRHDYDDATLSSGTTRLGLGCITVSTSTPCGEVILRTFGVTPSLVPQWSGFSRDFVGWASEPLRFGNRVFMITDGPQVECVDISTGNVCSGYPRQPASWAALTPNRFGPTAVANDSANHPPEVEKINGDLYATIPLHDASGTVHLVCFDPASNAPCTGFGEPVIATGWPWSIEIFEHWTAGVGLDGLCLYIVDVSDIDCRALDNSSTWTRNDLAPLLPAPADRNLAEIHRWGPRIYVPNIWGDSTQCIHLTGAVDCGRITGNGALPYGYDRVKDTNCIVGLGDGSRFFTFERFGLGPCPSGSGSVEVVPCACSDGSQFWGVVLFDQAFLAQFDSFTVTARDPAGVVVAGPVDVTTNGGRLDLSGVPATTPRLNLDFQATLPPAATWTQPLEGEITVTERPALRR